MDANFDELGNYVGPEEYSDSDASEHDSWEDVTESAEDNAIVKSLYGPNVEVAHYKHDTQDARLPLVTSEKQSVVTEVLPGNWEFHKGLMDSAPGLVRNIAIVGQIKHGKSSFIELFTGQNTTNFTLIEKQRQLTLNLSCHTALVQNSVGKTYVLNLADTPGHTDFDDEVEASRTLAENAVLVVDAVEGPVLSRFHSSSMVVVNKIDKFILDMRLPPSKAFDRLRYLIEEELSVDPEQVVFMSTKFCFAFTLRSMASIYTSYQKGQKKLTLWNSENFVSYVLDPLYKLFSCGLIGADSQETLASLDISLTREEWLLNYDDRIRLILQRFFEDPMYTAVVDALIDSTQPPYEDRTAKSQVALAKHVRFGEKIFSLVRVRHGNLHSNSSQSLYVPLGSNVIAVEAVRYGNWALVNTTEGVPAPLKTPLVKVGIEPLRDSLETSEKLASGLEILSKIHPGLEARVLETGEYCIWGSGELYIDCVIQEFKDLTGCAMHLGTPASQLMETVSVQSNATFSVKTSTVSVTVHASPLSSEVANELDGTTDAKKILLKSDRNPQGVCSIWSAHNGNILSDDMTPPLLDFVNPEAKSAIIEGFRWAIREGPLMEDPVRGVHFKIIDGDFNGNAQLVPVMRRACHAAMLVAKPRVMEPWMRVTVIGRLSAGKAAYSELAKRRGRVESDRAVLGSNLYVTQGVMPLMDSFGFEIDVLCNMPQRDEGQVNLEFCDWRIVEGDPLDTSMAVPRSNPAHGHVLARDYMLKTRRRKGLISEVSLKRYLDEEFTTTFETRNTTL